MITLPTASTALILIDLQKGIVARQFAPYSFEAVLAKGKELARRFRVAKAPVVLVNVAFAPDLSDALKAPVDRPMQAPPGGFPEDWSELADGLAEASDLDTVFLGAVRELFSRAWRGTPMLRLVGVELSTFSSGSGQLELLDAGRSEKLERLARATDRLRDRFGFSKIQLGGSLTNRDHHD